MTIQQLNKIKAQIAEAEQKLEDAVRKELQKRVDASSGAEVGRQLGYSRDVICRILSRRDGGDTISMKRVYRLAEGLGITKF